jgi:hypothetical protein
MVFRHGQMPASREAEQKQVGRLVLQLPHSVLLVFLLQFGKPSLLLAYAEKVKLIP